VFWVHSEDSPDLTIFANVIAADHVGLVSPLLICVFNRVIFGLSVMDLTLCLVSFFRGQIVHKNLSSDGVSFVDDSVQQLLLFHESVILSFLAHELLDGAVLPLRVCIAN